MAGLTPPARSWFRLASIARMEAAEAAAAAATARATTTPTPPLPPIPPIPRPPPQPTSPPPPPPPIPPPQPPPPPSPTPQPEIQTQAPAATETAAPPPSPNGPPRPSTPPRAATPPESPKLILPSHSSPPPSARQTNSTPVQPPPHPEPEPEPETEPQRYSAAPEQRSIINSGSHHKLQGKEEKQLRAITMAGENAGAVMDIGSAAPRRLGRRIHGADGNGGGGKVEQEEADRKKGGRAAAKAKQMEAVVNSNVQGINNSIVLNSSTTQNSPGVHITFASNRKAKGSAASPREKEHDSDHLR